MIEQLSAPRAVTEQDYWWQPQLCPTCETEPQILLGIRGGKAHRNNLGVESKIWRCAGCRLIFPNPMPIPKLGLAQHYSMDPEVYFQGHEDAPKDTAMKATLEQVRRILGGTGRLLDVGSGRGHTIKAAQELGWEVVGIEPSHEFAADIRKRYGVEVLEDSIESCPLPEGSFDAVILSATLEHLYTPRASLEKIARLLRPKGVVYMDVPNEDSLFCRASNLYVSRRRPKLNANLSPTFPPFHIFGFNPYSLTKLLEACGLTPVKCRFHSGRTRIISNHGWKGWIEARSAEMLMRLSRGRRLCYQFEVWAQRP